jgi:hypothetical protein
MIPVLGQGLIEPAPRQISELTPAIKIRVGKTADWVATTTDAVWVGSTGPYAVHRIDPGDKQARGKRPPTRQSLRRTGDGLWKPVGTDVHQGPLISEGRPHRQSADVSHTRGSSGAGSGYRRKF